MPDNFGANVPPPVEGSPVWFLRWLEKFRLWIKRELANALEDLRREARQAAYDGNTGGGDTGGTGGGGGGGGTGGSTADDPVETEPSATLPMESLFLAADGVYRGVPGATGINPETTTYVTDFLREDEGWTVGGVGAPTSTWASSLGHPGELTLSTSLVINDSVTLVPDLGIEAEPEDIYEFVWVFKISANTSAKLYVGLGDNVGADYLGNNSVGIACEVAGTVNWYAFTVDGGVRDDNDVLNYPVTAAEYIEFRAKRLGSMYEFRLNGQVLGTVPQLPSAQMEPMVRLVTTALATKSVTLDYFGMRFYTGARY